MLATAIHAQPGVHALLLGSGTSTGAGDWDHVLVAAIEGTRSRRYPLFWTTYGPLGDAAKRLVAQHRAHVIEGAVADEVFPDLLSRIEALDTLAEPPLSKAMAIARLKRALPDPIKHLDLRDLFEAEIANIRATWREEFGNRSYIPATQVLHDWKVLRSDVINSFPKWEGVRWHFPMSHLFKQELRPVFLPFIGDEDSYSRLFHRVEYRTALAQRLSPHEGWVRSAPGEFIIERNWGHDTLIWERSTSDKTPTGTRGDGFQSPTARLEPPSPVRMTTGAAVPYGFRITVTVTVTLVAVHLRT